jgi:hypothetical protein
MLSSDNSTEKERLNKIRGYIQAVANSLYKIKNSQNLTAFELNALPPLPLVTEKTETKQDLPLKETALKDRASLLAKIWMHLYAIGLANEKNDDLASIARYLSALNDKNLQQFYNDVSVYASRVSAILNYIKKNPQGPLVSKSVSQTGSSMLLSPEYSPTLALQHPEITKAIQNIQGYPLAEAQKILFPYLQHFKINDEENKEENKEENSTPKKDPELLKALEFVQAFPRLVAETKNETLLRARFELPAMALDEFESIWSLAQKIDPESDKIIKAVGQLVAGLRPIEKRTLTDWELLAQHLTEQKAKVFFFEHFCTVMAAAKTSRNAWDNFQSLIKLTRLWWIRDDKKYQGELLKLWEGLARHQAAFPQIDKLLYCALQQKGKAGFQFLNELLTLRTDQLQDPHQNALVETIEAVSKLADTKKSKKVALVREAVKKFAELSLLKAVYQIGEKIPGDDQHRLVSGIVSALEGYPEEFKTALLSKYENLNLSKDTDFADRLNALLNKPQTSSFIKTIAKDQPPKLATVTATVEHLLKITASGKPPMDYMAACVAACPAFLAVEEKDSNDPGSIPSQLTTWKEYHGDPLEQDKTLLYALVDIQKLHTLNDQPLKALVPGAAAPASGVAVPQDLGAIARYSRILATLPRDAAKLAAVVPDLLPNYPHLSLIADILESTAQKEAKENGLSQQYALCSTLLKLQFASSNKEFNAQIKTALLQHLIDTNLAFYLSPAQLQEYCDSMLRSLEPNATEGQISLHLQVFIACDRAFANILQKPLAPEKKATVINWYLKLLNQRNTTMAQHLTRVLDKLNGARRFTVIENFVEFSSWASPEHYSKEQFDIFFQYLAANNADADKINQLSRWVNLASYTQPQLSQILNYISRYNLPNTLRSNMLNNEQMRAYCSIFFACLENNPAHQLDLKESGEYFARHLHPIPSEIEKNTFFNWYLSLLDKYVKPVTSDLVPPTLHKLMKERRQNVLKLPNCVNLETNNIKQLEKLLDYLTQNTIAFELTGEKQQRYCETVMQCLSKPSDIDKNVLIACEMNFNLAQSSLVDSNKKEKFFSWYLNCLNSHLTDDKKTFIAFSTALRLSYRHPIDLSTLLENMAAFTTSQLKRILDFGNLLLEKNNSDYYQLIKTLFAYNPSERANIDVLNLITELDKIRNYNNIILFEKHLESLITFINTLPKNLPAQDLNKSISLFFSFIHQENQQKIDLLLQNLQSRPHGPQNFNGVSVLLRSKVVQLVQDHVEDKQQNLFFETAKHFYTLAKDSGKNLQTLFASLQHHFDFNDPTKQQQRIAFMHLLFQRALILEKAATDQQWDAEDNQQLLNLCFAVYVKKSKAILAAKKKPRLHQPHDLDLNQHQQLLNLANELKLIGSQNLPEKPNPLKKLSTSFAEMAAALQQGRDFNHRQQQQLLNTKTFLVDPLLNGSARDDEDEPALEQAEAAMSGTSTATLNASLKLSLQHYSAAWFKSASRQKQLDTLKNEINTNFKSLTPRYDQILAVLRKAKNKAMKEDIEVNKSSWFRRWFKGHNSEGNSRYYNTLNKMYDAVLESWSQDLSACHGFGHYRDYLEKDMQTVARRVSDALAGLLGLEKLSEQAISGKRDRITGFCSLFKDKNPYAIYRLSRFVKVMKLCSGYHELKTNLSAAPATVAANKKLEAILQLLGLSTGIPNPAVSIEMMQNLFEELLKNGPDKLVDDLLTTAGVSEFLSESGKALLKVLLSILPLSQTQQGNLPLPNLVLSNPQFLASLDKNIPLLSKGLPGHVVTLLKELQYSSRLLKNHLEEQITPADTTVMNPGVLFKNGA